MWSIAANLRRRAAPTWLGAAVALATTGPMLFTPPALGQPLDDVEEPGVALQTPGTPTAPNPPAIRPGTVTKPPPTVGAVVVEDSLTSGGLVPTGSCPSGRALAETVGEGLIFKVRGPCTGDSTVAIAQTQIPGLRIPDGELRFETRFVSAPERASLAVFIRSSEVNGRRHGYGFVVGTAGFVTVLALGDGGSRPIGTGVAMRIPWTEWNTVSIRVQGDGLWVTLNDAPIVYAADGTFADGEVGLSLLRTGNLNDETEAAIVFRNMRVSALEGSDPTRAPEYQRREQGPPPSSDEPPPLPPKPANCNDIRWERAPNGRWILWCDQTNWQE